MEKQNDWLEGNIREINELVRQLIDYHMKGSYGGELRLLQIERLLRGAADQILRLQKEVNGFTELTKQTEKMMSGFLSPSTIEILEQLVPKLPDSMNSLKKTIEAVEKMVPKLPDSMDSLKKTIEAVEKMTLKPSD